MFTNYFTTNKKTTGYSGERDCKRVWGKENVFTSSWFPSVLEFLLKYPMYRWVLKLEKGKHQTVLLCCHSLTIKTDAERN